jgi:hypothetical protein
MCRFKTARSEARSRQSQMYVFVYIIPPKACTKFGMIDNARV